ncbi:MAG: hypothetical protein JWM44_974 [Bacilli bacterium]|nr:hypothetical protein [Bacilli bacterium]
MIKYEGYLKELGIYTQANFAKLTEVYNVVSGLCNDDILSIFISEYQNTEKTVVVESLFLFSDKYLIEIKQPLGNNLNWDIINYKGCFDFIDVKSSSFDYHLANNDSRLTVVSYLLNATFSNTFKASGKNCNHLLEILNERIKPNLNIKSVVTT